MVTYTDKTVEKGKRYYYRVLANNLVGDPTSVGFQTVSAPSETVSIVIPVTPTITWSNPADICQGTPSELYQLDAFATNLTFTTAPGVPGTYHYDPGVGTVLSAGQHQPLSVTFAPSEKAAEYNTQATKTIYINVNECPEKHGFFHETEYSTYLPFQWDDRRIYKTSIATKK